jgi:hypothetical protein
MVSNKRERGNQTERGRVGEREGGFEMKGKGGCSELVNDLV